MKSSAKKVELASVDDLFTTEQERQEADEERVVRIPLTQLHYFKGYPAMQTEVPFTGQPYRFKDDDPKMQETLDSVKKRGVRAPGLVRPDPDGGYEIISGHRRHRASELAGLEDMPVIIRDMTDEEAVIEMVDANIQREHISPMEKARALKMKNEAMKRSAGRRKGNGCQLDTHFPEAKTATQIGADVGESPKQIFRYIRLNELIPELQKKVESNTLKFNPAVELSYLTPDEQQSFLDYAEAQDCTPSLSQAQKLKAASKEGTLTLDKLEEIMSAQKPSVAPREPVLNINVSKVAQYFPTGCTKQQMENRILKILESYFRQMAHEQAHEEER